MEYCQIKRHSEIMRLLVTTLILILLVCTESTAQSWFGEQQADSTHDLYIDFGGTYQYSPIRGFLQTPRGGNPGTTSQNRPTFKELDLDTVSFSYSSLSIRKDIHGFYVRIQLVHLAGDSVLNNELTSQGVIYPAGSQVSADVSLDLYRIGYQHRFFFQSNKHGRFEIDPTIEIAFFDFHYKLDSLAGLSTDRSYVKGACRIGAEAHWYANDRLTISAGAIGPVPISNTPQIWTLDLTAKYQLWGKEPRGGAAIIGIGYQHTEYQDNQTVPNHIKFEMSPILRAGLQIGF